MKMVPLGEVAAINPRSPKLQHSEDVAFVGMAQLDEASAVAVPREYGPYSNFAHGYTPFEDGDILAAKITPCWENGKIGQAHLGVRYGMGSTEFHVVRPTDAIDVRYALHFIRQSKIRDTGTLRMTGSAGQRRVPTKYLTDLAIPLPPLDEQRRIAAILDKADAIRQKRRQAITHLDTLTQSIFNEMFGNHPQTQSFSNVVAEFRYGTSNKSGETGYPTLRIPNVVPGHLKLNDLKTVSVSDDELERLRLNDGDLLFVRTNGNKDNVGKCSLFDSRLAAASVTSDEPWIYASYLIRARLKEEVLPEFAHAYFQSVVAQRRLQESSKTSAGQYNVNIAGIGDVPVPVVSMEQQIEFARLTSEVRKPVILAQEQFALSHKVFASLQYRAFRGEL